MNYYDFFLTHFTLTIGVITPSFSLIWMVMLVVYWRIWREAAGHARRLRAAAHSGTPSDWKSVQVK